MAASNLQDLLNGRRPAQAQGTQRQVAALGASPELNQRFEERWAQDGSAWEAGPDGMPQVTQNWTPRGMKQMGPSGMQFNPGGGRMGHSLPPQQFMMSDNSPSPERQAVSPNTRVMQSPSLENYQQAQRQVDSR